MNQLNTFESVLAVVLMMGGTWKAFDYVWTRYAERIARGCTSAALALRATWARLVTALRRRAPVADLPELRVRNAGMDRQSVREQVARDMAHRGYTARAFHFPADAHAPEKLDRESGYGTSTRLSVVPKGDAA